MLVIYFLFLLMVSSSLSDEWHSKSQCTQKEFANHMDINCNPNEFILIGWSHYGTKKNKQDQQRCEPSESDCIMDYTHKIAELCNGVSKCEVILTQQFIHKCSDEATYLFISYQCINNSTILDVCSKRSITSSTGVSLISPLFPNEYPNNINCTCSIESTDIIDIENLSFNLQDNDDLLSLSGTIPFGASLLTAKNQLDLKFQTDETLSQSGFWIRLYGYNHCNDDEYTLGSKCMKIFSKKQIWQLAQEKCLSINSNLIRLDDIIQEKKLAHFLLINHEQQPTSFWISNEKEKYDVHSWWPWRSSSNTGKCVLRTQDGWIKMSCNEKQSFICERDINRQSKPVTVRCGNAQPTTISSTITTTTQPSTTIAFIQQGKVSLKNDEQNSPTQQSSSSINRLQKTTNENKITAIDPNILAAVISGIAIAIFSVNVAVCYICKRRSQNQSKCKTANESQSSFTHEELQHSLIQHLYHEQTNTISSTSTSSSNHSQSKSNDTTTTTNTNLLQLSSPPHPSNLSQSYVTRSNDPPTTLCFRNTHTGLIAGGDPVDYHVYETIPSENTSYASHNAFKPMIQSNIHTIRPYHPRTNILYHPSGSSKQSHDILSSIPTTTTVLMPVCCHHYSSQCLTGTLRQHVLPSPSQINTQQQQQISIRSESIV